MKTTLALTFALLASCSFAGQSLEFVGYMTDAKDRSFVLYDSNAQCFSPWIRPGQSWRGYTVKRFDISTEELTVVGGVSEQVIRLRSSKVGKGSFVVNLIRGTYQVVDGTMAYGAGAQIRIGGKIVSSSTGVLVSDDRQRIFAGDFSIETPNGIMQYKNGVMRVSEGGTEVTADEATFTPKPSVPNQLPDPKSPSVTPPAGAGGAPSVAGDH